MLVSIQSAKGSGQALNVTASLESSNLLVVVEVNGRKGWDRTGEGEINKKGSASAALANRKHGLAD